MVFWRKILDDFSNFQSVWPWMYPGNLTTHSIPLLMSLHGLPVNFRIRCKISLLKLKTLTTKQPTYLHDLLSESVHNCALLQQQSATKGALYQVQDWIQCFLMLCTIPIEQTSYFSPFCYLYHFFLQVPQNLPVWPCLSTLGLLYSGLSLLTTTDCTRILDFHFRTGKHPWTR